MQIQRTNYSPAFSAKFINNKEMREVIQLAKDNNCMRTLDSALNTLKGVDDKTIRVLHGKTSEGRMYSTFMVGKRSVPNDVYDVKSPAEASLDGILELSMLKKKYKSLMGVSTPQDNLTVEKMIKDYTV